MNMSVLDRVKLFLPQIEKANADLEKEISLHGNDRFLIDKDLAAQVTKTPMIVETDAASSAVQKSTDDCEQRSSDNDSDVEIDDDDISKHQIELNFALGDFNETALAKAEEEMRLAADNVDGNQEDNEDEEG